MDAFFSANPPGVREALQQKKILIAGCGGLGSNVAMMLVRAGADDLSLVDFDDVSASNLNRQFFFFDQLGLLKVEALADNLKRINPQIKLTLHAEKLNLQQDFSRFDVVVECFDQPTYKAQLSEVMLGRFSHTFYVCCSGLAGVHALGEMRIKFLTEKSCMVGDFQSDLSEGVVSSRVMGAAALQVHAVINFLMGKLLCHICF